MTSHIFHLLCLTWQISMFSGSFGEVSLSSKMFDDDELRGQVFTNVAIYKVCDSLFLVN